MLCSEFDARLHQLLDERKAPEQDWELQCHARNCPRCAARLETMLRLLDSLELSQTPEVSSRFAQRVVEAVDQPPPTRPLSTRGVPTRLVPLMVAAAGLLLVATPLAWYAVKPDVGAVPSPPRPSSTNSTAQLAGPEADSSPTQMATDASEDWLLSGTLVELYSQATDERHREQMTRIADDLRPIATPFNAALTAIRRSIRVDTSETEREPRAMADPTGLDRGVWAI